MSPDRAGRYVGATQNGEPWVNGDGIAGDLARWAACAGSAGTDPGEMRGLLARLASWKARHDDERAGLPNPFRQMMWDAVFADEDERVTNAIDEIEAALAGS